MHEDPLLPNKNYSKERCDFKMIEWKRISNESCPDFLRALRDLRGNTKDLRMGFTSDRTRAEVCWRSIYYPRSFASIVSSPQGAIVYSTELSDVRHHEAHEEHEGCIRRLF